MDEGYSGADMAIVAVGTLLVGGGLIAAVSYYSGKNGERDRARDLLDAEIKAWSTPAVATPDSALYYNGASVALGMARQKLYAPSLFAQRLGGGVARGLEPVGRLFGV